MVCTHCETTLYDDDMYSCLSLSVYVNIYSLNNDNNDNNNNTNNDIHVVDINIMRSLSCDILFIRYAHSNM